MGNTTSIWRNIFPLGNDGGQTFWLGSSAAINSSRIPSCWDELLDWSEDASNIVQTYLLKKHQQQNQQLSQTTSAVTSNNHDNDDDNNTSNNKKSDDAVVPKETSTHLSSSSSSLLSFRFEPIVLKCCKDEVYQIPSMNLMDRTTFFAENVFMTIKREGHEVAVFGVMSFIKLHKLLLAYMEYLVLSQIEPPKSNNDSGRRLQCTICLEVDETTSSKNSIIVLPCSHRMCSDCYERWVHRKLTCPFCRYEFHRRSVRQSQWEILDWGKLNIGQDIRQFEAALDSFLASLDTAKALLGSLEMCEEMSRTLRLCEEQDVIIVN